MTDPRWIARDPDGLDVLMRVERWAHIVGGHPELFSLEERVRRAIESPTRRLAGRSADERWFYLELIPPVPARWLKVVVRYGRQENWIVTAFLRRSLP